MNDAFNARMAELADDFGLFNDWSDRYEYIISLGKELPPLDDRFRRDDLLIKGCQSRVWLGAEYRNGLLCLSADSDSLITKGLIAIFIRLLSGLSPEEILRADLSRLDALGLRDHLAPTRANALNTMAARIKSDAAACSSAS